MRWVVLVIVVAAATDASAQRFFHDTKRDETAQEAAAAARQIGSGSLFETMLRNVDAQARLEADTEMAFVQERLRAKLNAFQRWSDPQARPVPLAPPPGADIAAFLENARRCNQAIGCVLQSLAEIHREALAETASQVEIDQRLLAIAQRQDELKEELRALQAAGGTADPAVVAAFAALEDPGKDLLELAQKIAGDAGKPTAGVKKGLDAIAEGLDQLLALYHAVAGIWKGQRAVSVEPSSLRPPQQQTDLLMLTAEQEHLTALARIEARKHVEVAAALAGVESALARLEEAGVAHSPETVESSLRAAAVSHDRRRLLGLITALHEATAAISQLDASSGLAALRRSDEQRRYSIRRSLVAARAYDQTIQAAVDRLGLYWKSGIKPGELAQFIFYVANAIAVPVIAAKQD